MYRPQSLVIGYACLLIMIMIASISGIAQISKENSAAMVINADRMPDVVLPSIDNLVSHPEMVVSQYNRKGYRVVADPSGRCLAIIRSPNTSTDSSLDLFNIREILRTLTKEQLAHRTYGYLSQQALTAQQLSLTKAILIHHGIIQANSTADSQISIGLWPTWEIFAIAVDEDGLARSNVFDFTPEPPTSLAVNHPQLAGRLLWTAWPYSTSAYITTQINITPGTYTLRQIADLIFKRTNYPCEVQTALENSRVAVIAQNQPLQSFLWAIEIATGTQVTVFNTNPPKILIESGIAPERAYRHDLRDTLLSPQLDYFSPTETTAGRILLEHFEGGDVDPTANWVGWPFGELPLLYRNWLAEIIGTPTHDNIPHPVPSLTADTRILWVKAIQVVIRSGQNGIPYKIPVLDPNPVKTK